MDILLPSKESIIIIIDMPTSNLIPLFGPNPTHQTHIIFKAKLDSTGYPAFNRSIEIYNDNELTYHYHYIGQQYVIRHDSDPNYVYFDFGNDQYFFIVGYHLKQRDQSYLLVKNYEYQLVDKRYPVYETLFSIQTEW